LLVPVGFNWPGRRRFEQLVVRQRGFPDAAPMLTNGTGTLFICCVPILMFRAGASPLAPVTVTSYVSRSEYWSLTAERVMLDVAGLY
jgi:hypothetical protein